MSTKEKLFRVWSEEGFRVPVFGQRTPPPSLQTQDDVHMGQPEMPWKTWHLEWFHDSKHNALPDVASSPIPASCSERAADLLWPGGAADFELLPIFVDNEPWRLLCSTRLVNCIDRESSDIDWSEREEGGRRIQSASHIRWINVVDSRASELDAFRLSIQPKVWVYFTERFVRRYFALGLRGVRFEHVGYIVDKPEDAIPPPPRPVVHPPQAPRWPKWEIAPEEEVAHFTQAGETFMQTRGLSASSEPSAVLAALAVEIEAHRPGFGKLKPKARKELLSGLAGAFGLLLRRQLHWNWVDLQVTSSAWDLGLASPNISHALCLNQVMVRQLTSPEPSTIVLLFNMIASGNLPDAQPGDHVAIG